MLFINANTTGKVVRPWPEQFLWPWFVSSVVQRLLRTGCSRNRKSISNATKIVEGDTCPVLQCSLDYDERQRNRKEYTVWLWYMSTWVHEKFNYKKTNNGETQN